MVCCFSVALFISSFIIGLNCSFSYADIDDSKALVVGKELWEESLPLKMGSRMYHLQGLKPYTWYEVKISYPASVPASFSIQLKKEKAHSAVRRNRLLLNTEKLIFKTDDLDNDEIKLYALVTVEPEGVVAMPNIPEREFIIFNIVCDELFLGIPHKAWWVGVLVLLCLGLAFIIPGFLPSNLLKRNACQSISKEY